MKRRCAHRLYDEYNKYKLDIIFFNKVIIRSICIKIQLIEF